MRNLIVVLTLLITSVGLANPPKNLTWKMNKPKQKIYQQPVYVKTWVNEKANHDAIVRVLSGESFCSGFVIGPKHVLTAAHCIDGENLHIQNLKQTKKVPAKLAGINTTADYAVVTGDFKEFNTLTPILDRNGFLRDGDFVACGFPYGQTQINCYQVVPGANFSVFMSALGFLYPGMSGGPVIDLKTNEVVGLNSAVTQGIVILAPLVGMETILRTK